MFKTMDSSAIIIIFLLAIFIYEVHDGIVSRDKNLETVCASYSKLVDAINREVLAGDYTINGQKFPNTKTEEGQKHYQMISLHHKIIDKCSDVYGINSTLPSPQELRGQ